MKSLEGGSAELRFMSNGSPTSHQNSRQNKGARGTEVIGQKGLVTEWLLFINSSPGDAPQRQIHPYLQRVQKMFSAELLPLTPAPQNWGSVSKEED